MTRAEIESGQDLGSALEALPHAWITAVGEIEDVELYVATAETTAERTLRGPWTLASLAGPGAGPFWVVLSRSGDAGVQVVAGRLKRATSRCVHVFGSGPGTAQNPNTHTAEAVAKVPAAKEAEAGWAAQAQAAAPAPATDDDEDSFPDAGDLVEHFAFGLCDVLMASGDRLKIRDKNGPGRLREIRIEVLKVHAPVAKDGKRLFKLERKN